MQQQERCAQGGQKNNRAEGGARRMRVAVHLSPLSSTRMRVHTLQPKPHEYDGKRHGGPRGPQEEHYVRRLGACFYTSLELKYLRHDSLMVNGESS